MILFCLPYAGGSESIYYKWKYYLNPSINLYPIELKGRGKRFNEYFCGSIEETIDDILHSIKDIIYNNDYAIYGHSMGGLLAYEIYYKINEMGLRKARHIFFSGCRAPNIIRKREDIYTLPDYDFMRKVTEFGGISQELLDNKEWLNIFIPIIRNDFKILETYKYKKRSHKIECDVSILNGKQDDINSQDILEWKNHLCKSFKVHNFEGNHFFINSNIENICTVINDTLI